jgi:hypothetical protein
LEGFFMLVVSGWDCLILVFALAAGARGDGLCEPSIAVSPFVFSVGWMGHGPGLNGAPRLELL